MERLTEKRDGQNVIPLRQNGKIKWAICSAGLGDAPTKYLYGDHADRLAAYEDILGNEYDLDRLRELVQADRDGRCSISPKLICIDEVTTPTPEQYRWMMGRFLKGEQDG